MLASRLMLMGLEVIREEKVVFREELEAMVVFTTEGSTEPSQATAKRTTPLFPAEDDTQSHPESLLQAQGKVACTIARNDPSFSPI